MKEKKIIFHYTKDEEDKMDTSYVYLRESLKNQEAGKSVQQIIIDDKGIEGNKGLRGEIIVDLDSEGCVIGIELLGDIIPDDLK